MKNISDRKKFWETAQPYFSEKHNKLLRLEKILRFWLMKKNWRLIDQIFCILYIFCVLQFTIIMKSLFFSLDLNSKLIVIISSIIDIQRVFTWDFISSEILSFNCLYDTARSETHRGCYFIVVILTEM